MTGNFNYMLSFCCPLFCSPRDCIRCQRRDLIFFELITTRAEITLLLRFKFEVVVQVASISAFFPFNFLQFNFNFASFSRRESRNTFDCTRRNKGKIENEGKRYPRSWQNEYYTGRYVRLPFSFRKSFLRIDRFNGRATVKPINLQIRCKMNYWSRFRSYAIKEIAVDAFHSQLVNSMCKLWLVEKLWETTIKVLTFHHVTSYNHYFKKNNY